MKTFNDNNSIEQQENRNFAQFVKRAALYRQFAGDILSNTATTLVVAGNATTFIAVDNVVLVPLDDFETEHIVTGISYNGGNDETTITCDGSIFNSTVVGNQVARKYLIGGGDIERLAEMSPVRFDMEGPTLNTFLASEVQVALDNGDGFFSNSSNNGILDNADVLWLAVWFGWKGGSDRLLYFGGKVEREEIEDDRFSKQVRCTAFGHLKELERYPAFAVNDAERKLLDVRGVKIAKVGSVSPVSDKAHVFKYDFPAQDKLSALAINSISQDTPVGYRVIKFRPPDLFQYDYGAWTQQVAGTEDVTLTSAKGHTVNVNIPKELDVVARYVLFVANDDGAGIVLGARGAAQMQFGSGAAQDVIFDFSHVVRDAGGYSDLTYNVNNDFRAKVTLLAGDDHAIYFIADEKFHGIEMAIPANSWGGTTLWEYSQGFNAWGSLSTSTTTNNYNQDGHVSWNLPGDWQPVTIDFGGSIGVVAEKYVARFTMDFYAFGSLDIFSARPLLRVISDDTTWLNIEANLDKLTHKGFSEDVIIENDGAGGLTASTWLANVPLEKLAIDLLDHARYPAAKRTLSPFRYTLLAQRVNNYGQPPIPFTTKKCTALAVDSSTSPATVYCGIGDEVWKVTDTDDFELIGRIDGFDDHRLEIKRLVIDGNGYLQGVAWKPFDRKIIGGSKSGKRSTPAVVFRSTNKTAITESAELKVGGLSFLCSGEMTFRETRFTGSTYNVGAAGASPAGENITLPFRQFVGGVETVASSTNFTRTNGLTGTSLASETRTAEGNFSLGWLFGTATSADFIRYSLGQDGFCLWDEESDRWLIYYIEPFVERLSFVDYNGTTSTFLSLGSDQQQTLAGCVDGSGNAYVSDMVWDFQGASFPGDLSDCRLVKADFSVPGSYNIVFDFSTDSVAASQSLSGNHGSWAKIRSCSILGMAYNAGENTVHGCILDRFTLQYHWFVYDISGDALYSSQTGGGFDFNEGMQPKGFVYNSDDQKIYAVMTDRRYQANEAFLVCADYDSGRGAGSEIAIAKCASLPAGEFDLLANLIYDTGVRVYGVLGPVGQMFQYSTRIYPRVSVADFGDKNLREALTDCVQVPNLILQSRANRKLRATTRDLVDGSKTLQIEHVLKMEPLSYWSQQYDRVDVQWRNPVSGENGTAAAGSSGWGRRVLTVENPLVQDRTLAQIMADELLAYFGTLRQVVDAELIAQIELEEMDQVKFILSQALADVDRAQYWKVHALEFDPDGLFLRVRGVA